MPSGRFAQLARLSRKALRLYAEQGLLRPVHVNPDSGYRYYSLGQLEDARRISTLRALNMPLDVIREALRTWNTAELSRHLEQHREELLRQAERVNAALRALDHLALQAEPTYTVHVKTVVPQPYLGLRQWCAPEEACHVIARAQEVLTTTLHDALLSARGAPLARYHDEREDAWDVEVCVPFDGAAPARLPGSVTTGELPGGVAAYTVHAGDCGGSHGMQGAYATVWQWLHAHGHEPLGGPYEVYLFDETNTTDPADHRTEIAWLIKP